MDISPGPPFWRIIPDDMDIPLLGNLVLSGRPDADIHGAAVNFALKGFCEVGLPLHGVLGSSPSRPGKDCLHISRFSST